MTAHADGDGTALGEHVQHLMLKINRVQPGYSSGVPVDPCVPVVVGLPRKLVRKAIDVNLVARGERESQSAHALGRLIHVPTAASIVDVPQPRVHSRRKGALGAEHRVHVMLGDELVLMPDDVLDTIFVPGQ